MKILLLGGTGEAKKLATSLHNKGHQVIYSIAGLVRYPRLPCEVISGGFSRHCNSPETTDRNKGAEGLKNWLRLNEITLVIDATHPYAARISTHAVIACQQTNTPCWRFQRAPWSSSPDLPFQEIDDWSTLRETLGHYHRPVFTIGQMPLRHLDIPKHQIWLVRGAIYNEVEHPRLNQIEAIGPFSLAHEEQMLRLHHADLLVGKNSGGRAMATKLLAATHLQVPVILLKRPTLVAADREFSSLDELTSQL
ncbi:precorrin-6A/cobalt-precorrin-6A reductase [Aestuariirhabdus sp. LZHN29]|uniref:precorrin-6A/cobalt-precorrin-6A reductase n=1 Tax=Aestuariirhabdus sp. LZHN29 TaxID=3417462 RepID=UPI003CEDD69C